MRRARGRPYTDVTVPAGGAVAPAGAVVRTPSHGLARPHLLSLATALPPHLLWQRDVPAKAHARLRFLVKSRVPRGPARGYGESSQCDWEARESLWGREGALVVRSPAA